MIQILTSLYIPTYVTYGSESISQHECHGSERHSARVCTSAFASLSPVVSNRGPHRKYKSKQADLQSKSTIINDHIILCPINFGSINFIPNFHSLKNMAPVLSYSLGLLLLIASAWATLDKPVILAVATGSVNQGLLDHLSPTSSTWDQWGTGWIPSDCKTLPALYHGFPDATAFEVFNIHYSDVRDPHHPPNYLSILTNF
jgi:hypothetical protein